MFGTVVMEERDTASGGEPDRFLEEPAFPDPCRAFDQGHAPLAGSRRPELLSDHSQLSATAPDGTCGEAEFRAVDDDPRSCGYPP